MGNCLKSCFGKVKSKKTDYFSGRFNNSSIDIEFENLIEDDDEQRNHDVLTDDERNLLLNRRYTDLVQEQQKIDAKLDKELALEEENARLEEEAYNAAKQEASRAAKRARLLEMEKQRTKSQQSNGSTKAWLGDDAGDWEIATEDDFEAFLDTVKAKSETVRASGKMSYYIKPGSKSSNHHEDDDSDVEWEADFVSADSPSEPITITPQSSPAKLPTTQSIGSSNSTTIPSRHQPIKTGLPSSSRPNGSALANGQLPYKHEVDKEIETSLTEGKVKPKGGTNPVKPKKTLDIDIDKFLEELDFDT
ncbi:AP-1 complex-associated regulatory protein-like isoform X2 [Lytechinus variegatus]|uniref:AP-1 complex-associated regulatory protein-like isoform X2 n=1 Tax=Lytechinus variegatus TaxID=7654 RepID=UPI001BB20915|nr:AP-1 complex-associated regulatory protein-like isoform X2 [Lytechinus variegatus]